MKLSTFKERGLGTFVDDALERLQEVSEGLNTDDPTGLVDPMTKAVTILEELLGKSKIDGAELTVVKEVRSELRKLIKGFRDKFALIATNVAKKIHKIAAKMASGLDFAKKAVNSIQQGVKTFHTILERDATTEGEDDKAGGESLETTATCTAVGDSSQQNAKVSPTVPEKDDKIVKEEDDKIGDESPETTATYAAVGDDNTGENL
ncbi:MAG: hypothetical protein LBF25_00095 [Puniceicoccales bacterium]|nr:hypothetical protein [Puniceicoccales bacterium]